MVKRRRTRRHTRRRRRTHKGGQCDGPHALACIKICERFGQREATRRGCNAHCCNSLMWGGGRRKHSRHPRKRQASRTRKGRLDFVTHKGNVAFNRRGHRQYRRRRPYTRRKRRQRRR